MLPGRAVLVPSLCCTLLCPSLLNTSASQTCQENNSGTYSHRGRLAFFFAELLLCCFSSLNWLVACLGRSLGGNWLQSWVEEGLGAMLSALDSLRVEEQHHKSESYPACKHWACSAWISSDLLLCSCIAPQLLSPWTFLEPASLAIRECEKVLCIELIWE